MFYDNYKYFKDARSFILPPNNSMTDDTVNQMLKKKNTDTVLIIENKRIGAHAVVLRCFSELFAKQLRPGLTICLPTDVKVNISTFKLIYTWMTKGQIKCSIDELFDMVLSALVFYIPQLVIDVFQTVNNRTCCSETDALNDYFNARKHNLDGIAEVILNGVKLNLVLLTCTTEFREMDVKSLCTILRSNTLVVQSEIEVFYSVLFWLFTDYDQRKTHLTRIFQYVRFTQMSPKFIVNLARHLHEVPSELADQLYLSVHHARSCHKETRIFPLAHMPDRDRCWRRDPACPYVNRCADMENLHISPTEFMTYAQNLTWVTNSEY